LIKYVLCPEFHLFCELGYDNTTTRVGLGVCWCLSQY